MNIRNKLTLLFTFLFAIILLLITLFIYISSAETRKDEYYNRLRETAITKADLLLGAKVAPEVLQVIYKNADSQFQEEVAIYDTDFNLLYHDAVDVDKIKETQDMINEIIEKKEIQFKMNDLQAVGFLHRHKDNDYIITTVAQDEYGLTKLRNLKYSLLFAAISSLLLTILAGRLFSKHALKPVRIIVDKVEDITATNLDLRIQSENSKDEISNLANTFNRMLDRLENSFNSQKQFVSDISHELRTPMATIIAELELSQYKERSVTSYKEVINLTLTDAKRLAKLTNSLLDFAKASYDESEISFKKTRIDEVLLDARNEVIYNYPTYTVLLNFNDEIENEENVLVNGNEYLIRVAFINLIENACKFSENNQCKIAISFQKSHVIITFKDEGIGIPEEDIPNLFQPFYRGLNTDFAVGNGIGLSLSSKIVQLHKAEISVHSIISTGSTFTVKFPYS